MTFLDPVQFRWGPLSGLEGMQLRARAGGRWGPELPGAPWHDAPGVVPPGPLASKQKREQDPEHNLAVRGKATGGVTKATKRQRASGQRAGGRQRCGACGKPGHKRTTCPLETW